jgi:hypothetical protein
MIYPEIEHSGICPFTLQHYELYAVKDFLDPHTFSLLKDYVNSYVSVTKIGQNFDNQTITDKDGNTRKLMGYFENRPYRKLWDISHEPGYWAQSRATLKDFAYGRINSITHPVIKKVLYKIRDEVAIFQGQDWIPLRGLINILHKGQTLDIHFDGNLHLLDLPDEVMSSTLYLNIPTKGGNLWFADDYLYETSENALAIFDGNKIMHCATAPDDIDPDFIRLAITVRWVKPSSFLLPADGPLLYEASV